MRREQDRLHFIYSPAGFITLLEAFIPFFVLVSRQSAMVRQTERRSFALDVAAAQHAATGNKVEGSQNGDE